MMFLFGVGWYWKGAGSIGSRDSYMCLTWLSKCISMLLECYNQAKGMSEDVLGMKL